jgi:hypothetical protein
MHQACARGLLEVGRRRPSSWFHFHRLEKFAAPAAGRRAPPAEKPSYSLDIVKETAPTSVKRN